MTNRSGSDTWRTSRAVLHYVISAFALATLCGCGESPTSPPKNATNADPAAASEDGGPASKSRQTRGASDPAGPGNTPETAKSQAGSPGDPFGAGRAANEPGSVSRTLRASGTPDRDGKPAVSPEDREKAVAALKKLGAEIDQYADGTVVRVNLEDKKIRDADLAHLSKLPELEQLYLDGTGVTDEGMKHLAGLTRLDALSLSKTLVTGDGLEHLKNLKSLRALNLSRCPIGDDALVHLKPLTRLETLGLARTTIKGPGLEHLSGLTRIITLNLSGCSRLQGEHLHHLKALQRMKILYLEDVEVDEEYTDELEEAVTSLAIFD